MSTFYTGIQVFRSQTYTGGVSSGNTTALYTVPANRWAEVVFNAATGGSNASLYITSISEPSAINNTYGDHSAVMRVGAGKSVMGYGGSSGLNYSFSVVEFG
jgi:hypothetical protein